MRPFFYVQHITRLLLQYVTRPPCTKRLQNDTTLPSFEIIGRQNPLYDRSRSLLSGKVNSENNLSSSNNCWCSTVLEHGGGEKSNITPPVSPLPRCQNVFWRTVMSTTKHVVKLQNLHANAGSRFQVNFLGQKRVGIKLVRSLRSLSTTITPFELLTSKRKQTR